MKISRTQWSLALAGLVLTLTGCPPDGNPSSDDSDDGDSDGAVCDPMGADPQMGALLNAPVADDVEVIQKQPQHPGPAGPDDLP